MSQSRKSYKDLIERINDLDVSDEKIAEIFQESWLDCTHDELLALMKAVVQLNRTKTIESILSLNQLSSKITLAELIQCITDASQENTDILIQILDNTDPITQQKILEYINLEQCNEDMIEILTFTLLNNFNENVLDKWLRSQQTHNTVMLEIDSSIEIYLHRENHATVISIIDKLLHFNEEIFSVYLPLKSNMYTLLGKHKLAEEILLEQKETSDILSMLAMNSLHDATADAEKIAKYHRAFGKCISRDAPHFQLNTNPIAHNKKLNIGIVMEDVIETPCRYFMASLLDADPNQYQLIFFDCAPSSEKALQVMQQKNSNKINIINISQLSIRQSIHKIRQNKIDILFDISGLLDNKSPDFRMSIFAGHPAPVQFTYLGYPNSTGLKTMDYRIVDSITDPVGKTDKYYEEKLERLNGPFICFTPSSKQLEAEVNPVSPSTLYDDGIVTLGILNNARKLSDEFLIDLVRMLNEIPNSRLCFQYQNFWLNEENQDDLLARLEQFSEIDRSRIIFEGAQDNRVRWISDEIDIAIDTYPYNGTTTDYDCLLACVPLVTRTMEKRHEANVSASILTYSGVKELKDCITTTSDDFVQCVKELAENIELRDDLRADDYLRKKLLASPLCDTKSHKEKIWRLVREKWHVFCNTKSLKEQINLVNADAWEKLSDEESAQKILDTKIPIDELYKLGLLAILQNKHVTLAAIFKQVPLGCVADLIETMFSLPNKNDLISRLIENVNLKRFNDAVIYTENIEMMQMLLKHDVYINKCKEIGDNKITNYLNQKDIGIEEEKVENPTVVMRFGGTG